MRILVTGANGLLGANVCRELLNAGEKIVMFVKPSADLIGVEDLDGERLYGNLLSYKDVDRAVEKCDAVIHAASTTSQTRWFAKEGYLK